MLADGGPIRSGKMMEMERMKRLFLVRGLPGSGKTTLAKMITEYAVAADDFMVDDAGEYSFSPERLGECHGACQGRVKEWMEAAGHETIAVHNTFTQAWEATAYFRLADEFGYEVFVVSCENEFGNDHGVPEGSVAMMRERWEALR